MSFRSLHDLLILLIVEFAVSPTDATICFKYQNQIGSSGTDEETGSVPCDPNANVSACCHQGNICMSNLHCYDASVTKINRPGTCTDQSFRDPACPCPPTISLDYELDVTFCLDGSYCCGNNNTACCNTDNANLEIFYNNPATIPSASVSLSDYYSGLRLSTQSRSKFLSTSSSSSIQDLGTTSSGSQTALTPSSAARIVLSTSPTASSTNFSRISSSQSLNRPSGLCQSGKMAIEVAVPIVTILMAAFATWKILRRRRGGNAGMNTEEDEQNSTDKPMADRQSATGELPSGLDRAELVTKHWDSVELPARGAPAELGGHTRDCDLTKRLQ